MKLLKCYVENFGKLNEYTHNFHDGLNIIKQNNGTGKTTFANFIKAMFYGLDGGGKNSERARYIPWQGGNFGGYIEFEINGKNYKMERFFGDKKSKDTFKLYDLSTNLESHDYSENIGEEIFQINKDAYERSTYIPQGQIQINMEDSLSAKLGNVLESDNDINTSDEALKRLNDAKKYYKKDRGSGGLIDKKTDELTNLRYRMQNRKTDTEMIKKYSKNLEEKIEEIKKIEISRDKNQKLLSQRIEEDRKKAKQETYNNILNNYKKYEDNFNALDKFFNGDIPSEELLKDLENKNIEIERSKVEINTLKLSLEENVELGNFKAKFEKQGITDKIINDRIDDYSKLKNLDDEIREKYSEKEKFEHDLSNKKQEIDKKNKTSKLLLIIGIIALIFGIVTIVVSLLGIVLIIASFVIKKGKNTDTTELEKEIEKITVEIDVLDNSKKVINTQIVDLLNKTNCSENNILIELTNLKTDYAKYVELLEKQKRQQFSIQNVLAKKDILEKDLKNFLNMYYDELSKSYSELLQDIKIKKSQYENVKKQFDSLKIEKNNYEKENNVEEIKTENKITEFSEEELKDKLQELNNRYDVLIDEKNQLKNNIEVLENRIDDYEFLENKIENLDEEIKNLNEKYNILSKTEELLKQAKEQFSSSYLNSMIDGFNKYLEVINKDSMNAKVDINLDVSIESNGSQKELKYFSTGYKDLIYICMRFSLINALFINEAPFVVLDDPLVNLDEEKIQRAINVINEFTKKYQIIYFICHDSRGNFKI